MSRIILPLFFLAAAGARSQSPIVHTDHFDPRFELFTLPGGESANNVQCITQDQVGFLWFASAAGLHRYDGQQIVTYYHDPLDSASIASDYLEWVYAGRDGVLWLGYWGHGMSAFDLSATLPAWYNSTGKTEHRNFLLMNRLSSTTLSSIFSDWEQAREAISGQLLKTACTK